MSAHPGSQSPFDDFPKAHMIVDGPTRHRHAPNPVVQLDGDAPIYLIEDQNANEVENSARERGNDRCCHQINFRKKC